jgi:hypothetical protein
MRTPRFALASLVVAAAALGAPAAQAATACADAATSPAFAPWGDDALYSPFAGGGFEHGASGWSWGGKANIVSGDDDQLLATTGSHSVQLPGGGTAKSPWTCVDASRPCLRFFVRRVSGTGNLTVQGTLAAGAVPLTTFTVVSGTDTWQPSPVVVFPDVLTASVASGSANAQFLFTADPGTVYRIDDVELDPYKSR